MRLQWRLALSFGIGSGLLLGAVGVALWHWQGRQAQQMEEQLLADEWSDFQNRYTHFETICTDRITDRRHVLSTSLDLLSSRPNLVQDLVGQDEAALAQALQQGCLFSGIEALEAFEKGKGTLLRLSGRLAQTVNLQESFLTFHDQQLPYSPLLPPQSACLALLQTLLLYQTNSELPLLGPWAPLDWDWHMVALTLLHGPPGLVWVDAMTLQATLLNHSSVVSHTPLLTQSLHTAPPLLVLAPDHRDLFLVEQRRESERLLGVGASMADLVRVIGKELGITTAIVYEGVLLAGHQAPAMDAIWESLVKALPQPTFLSRVYGQAQIAGTPCFFAQVVPFQQEGLRIFLLKLPTAAGSHLAQELALLKERSLDQQHIFLLCGGVLFVALALYGWVLGVRLTKPLREAAAHLDRLLQGDHLGPRPPTHPTRTDEVNQLQISSASLYDRLADRERLQHLLDAFIAPGVAREFEGGVTHAGGASRQAAILFADIRGFTAQAAEMTAEETIVFLNACFASVAPVIEKEGGLIDKFIGDAVMGIFGAPQAMLNPATSALRAALGMRMALQNLNEQRVKRNLKPIAMGWGVAEGEVTAGIVGSEERTNYTALGTVVNLAARLCAVAGPNEVVLPVSMIHQLPQGIASVPDEVSLKGLGLVKVVRV